MSLFPGPRTFLSPSSRKYLFRWLPPCGLLATIMCAVAVVVAFPTPRSVAVDATIEKHPVARQQSLGPSLSKEPYEPGSMWLFSGEDYVLQTPAYPWNARDLRDDRSNAYVRLELREGDRRAADMQKFPGDHRERVEFARSERYPNGATIWTSFDFRYNGVYAPDWDHGSLIFHQIMSTPESDEHSKGPVVFFGLTSEDNLIIGTRSDARRKTIDTPGSAQRYKGPAPRAGVVHHFVMKAETDYHGDGSLQVWLDGEKIVSDFHIPLGYNDRESRADQSVKFGQYRPRNAYPVVTEFANVKSGTSSLKYLIDNPLPWQGPEAPPI